MSIFKALKCADTKLLKLYISGDPGHGGATNKMDRRQKQQEALIRNGLIRLYYGIEPVVKGKKLSTPLKLTPPRRRVWRAIVAMF